MTGNGNRSNELSPPPPRPGQDPPGAERRRRKPWTAPRLKTLDARGAPPGPSITDGVTWYQPQ